MSRHIPKVILYYKFTPIADPEAIKLWQTNLCETLNLKGRILISPHGINGTLGGAMSDLKKYMKTTRSYQGFKSTDFKWSDGTGNDFPKLKVKVKSELVPFGNPEEIKVGDEGVLGGGIHLQPEEVDQLVSERGNEVIFFDGRNSFEAKIGKFKDAVVPDVDTTQEFIKEIESGRYDYLKSKPIITYCTGGIRCEILSVIMKNRGFEEVYQITGGIVKYANHAGDDGLWEGSLFTFDDRLTLEFSDHTKLIGKCTICSSGTKSLRNCEKPDCHQLVLLCDSCYKNHLNLPCSHVREYRHSKDFVG
jgi:UPF0176 protein